MAHCIILFIKLVVRLKCHLLFLALGGTVDAVLDNPDLGETDDDFDLAQIKVLSTSKKACSRYIKIY